MNNKYIATILYYLHLTFKKILLKIMYCLNSNNLVVKKGNTLIKFNNDGDDQEVLYILNWNKYLMEELPQLTAIINRGDNVIDVGSNLGFFALLISGLVGSNGKVYCFEPSKIVYSKLLENLSLNKISNVIAENIGLGEKEEQKTLRRNIKYSGMSSILLDQDEEVVDEKIQISSIDEYFFDRNIKINLIKIDTEGFEPQVLRGALKIIKSQKPFIYIELGGGKFLKSSIEALKFLAEQGYSVSVSVEELEHVKAGTNFIATPR